MSAQNGSWPREFNFICDPVDFPDQNTTAQLLVIASFEGMLFDDNDVAVAIDTDGMVVGRDVIRNDRACDPNTDDTIISLAVYKDQDDDACAVNWGAKAGEIVRLIISHDGQFFEFEETFIFPYNDAADFAHVNGEQCYKADLDQTNKVTGFLPAELLAFRGAVHNQEVNLDWSVAREENVSHYEVQRSLDGNDWSVIGDVDALGDTDEATNYDFTDYNAKHGENYYRLNTIDVDGQNEISGIVIVSMETANSTPELSIFPNPAKVDGDLSLHLTGAWNQDEVITATLMDVSGRVLNQYNDLQIGTASVALPAGLNAGFYLVRIVQGGRVMTRKISIR